MKIKD
jgi:hypothetical protein